MYLKSLIETLESLPPDGIIRHGFGEPSSYRGDYEQLAFEPAKNVAVKEMLDNAKAAVGRTFEGYKDGEFSMGEYSLCNIAEYGHSSFGGDAISPTLVAYWIADCGVEN